MLVLSKLEIPPSIPVSVRNWILVEEVLREDIALADHVAHHFPCDWYLLA
jgi:hypothetical protein